MQLCWIFKTSMRPVWVHHFKFDLRFWRSCVPMTTTGYTCIALDKSLLRNLKLNDFLWYFHQQFKTLKQSLSLPRTYISPMVLILLCDFFKLLQVFVNIAGTIKIRENSLHYQENTIFLGFITLKCRHQVPHEYHTLQVYIKHSF